jgi:hypothetical protein
METKEIESETQKNANVKVSHEDLKAVEDDYNEFIKSLNDYKEKIIAISKDPNLLKEEFKKKRDELNNDLEITNELRKELAKKFNIDPNKDIFFDDKINIKKTEKRIDENSVFKITYDISTITEKLWFGINRNHFSQAKDLIESQRVLAMFNYPMTAIPVYSSRFYAALLGPIEQVSNSLDIIINYNAIEFVLKHIYPRIDNKIFVKVNMIRRRKQWSSGELKRLNSVCEFKSHSNRTQKKMLLDNKEIVNSMNQKDYRDFIEKFFENVEKVLSIPNLFILPKNEKDEPIVNIQDYIELQLKLESNYIDNYIKYLKETSDLLQQTKEDPEKTEDYNNLLILKSKENFKYLHSIVTTLIKNYELRIIFTYFFDTIKEEDYETLTTIGNIPSIEDLNDELIHSLREANYVKYYREGLLDLNSFSILNQGCKASQDTKVCKPFCKSKKCMEFGDYYNFSAPGYELLLQFTNKKYFNKN